MASGNTEERKSSDPTSEASTFTQKFRAGLSGKTDQDTRVWFRIYHNPLVSTATLKWFSRGFYLSIFLVFLYVVLHVFVPIKGEEVIYLSKEHLITVQALIDGHDVLLQDEASQEQETLEIPQEVFGYLKGVLMLNGEKGSPELIKYMEGQLEPFNRHSLITALPNIPFKVPSFFWLTGALLFLEIIFWSLFGVAASVLYRASEAISDGDFSAEKVPIHLAKILYAPLSTIIIIFSINLLNTDGSVAVDQISHRTIVLSFILGFFCGRTVELLRRIKDLILPYGADERQVSKNSGSKKGTIEVTGRVYFPSGEPSGKKLSDVTVSLSSMEDDNNPLPPIQADEHGYFSFYHRPPGHYLLSAEYASEDLQERYYVSRAILLNEEEKEKQFDLPLQQDQVLSTINGQN